MNLNNHRLGIVAAGMVGIGGILPATAELPTLQEKEWLGYFVGVKTRKFQFGVTGQGKVLLKVLDKKGDPMAEHLTVDVNINVEETMPNGKVVSRRVQVESLESAQPATEKPKDVVIRGKVTGDASFEFDVSESRSGVLLGGRLLDKGTLKNPVRFVLDVKIPDVYARESTGGDKKKEKALEDKMKDDRLQITLIDKKRVKPSMSEDVDAKSPEINGPGISELDLELGSYAGTSFEFKASANSAMTLSNDKPGPLRTGFLITWAADPQKDPEGKARLGIDIK